MLTKHHLDLGYHHSLTGKIFDKFLKIQNITVVATVLSHHYKSTRTQINLNKPSTSHGRLYHPHLHGKVAPPTEGEKVKEKAISPHPPPSPVPSTFS